MDAAGTGMTYVCTIPAVPPSLNRYTRMHWAAKERERESFQQMVWAVLNEKGNRCPRNLGAVDLHSVIVFTNLRHRDSDNYGSVLYKFVQDVLVAEGIIANDTADLCTGFPPALEVGPAEQTILMISQKNRS